MDKKGFTLIELLVVVGILSLIITGMTIAMQQQQRLFNLTEEAVDIDQTARTTLDYIATQVRNSVSRQGKFSISFVNGGSLPNNTNRCTNDTADSNTINSPPDCLTVFTWDITRGQYKDDKGTDSLLDDERILPSTAVVTEVVTGANSIIITLPNDWFAISRPPLLEANDLLGFRSRVILCDPDPDQTIICTQDPEKCTECAVILKVSSVDNAVKTATVQGIESVVIQNLDVADPPSTFSEFADEFINKISTQVNEMTIVDAKTFAVDTEDRELIMLSDFSGGYQPISGGINAPGIVDLQFVFNLQDDDGNITKVGVPPVNGNFADFNSDPLITGREHQIRSV
ncbi:MAG: type II secretion system protein, partial [Thermodesulfobacteriota bacterium]